MIDHLNYRSVKHTRHQLELTRPANTALGSSLYHQNHQFKRHIFLHNKSDAFKCIVYPIAYNIRNGKEIIPTWPSKSSSSSSSSTTSNRITEITYDLGMARLRLATTSPNGLDSWKSSSWTADGGGGSSHVWMEIRRGDEVGVQVELLSSSDVDVSSDMRVCFFYAESDLAAYAAYNYHQVSTTAAGNGQESNAGSSSSSSGHHLVDSLVKRLIVNNELIMAGELLCSSSMNESTVSRLSCRRTTTAASSSTSLSASSTSINDDSTLSALNISSLMHRLGSKPRTCRDDFLRLFRQALKCTIVSFFTSTMIHQDHASSKID